MVSKYISKENTKRIANGFLILGIVLLLMAPHVLATPGVTSYWGYVTVDGIAKPYAKLIVLDSSCKEVASTTGLQDATYQVTVQWDNPETPADEGVVNGEIITFRVDGNIAVSRTIDNIGTNTRLDIEAPNYSMTTCPAGNEMVEIRGEAAQGPFLWDANNFPAFFYDLNEDIGTETLNVKSISGRIIPVNRIDYSTQPEEMNFNYPDFGKYQVVGFIGDKYFAGYTANTTLPDPMPGINFSTTSTLASGQLHKVLLDDNTKRTISVGGTLALKNGYVLKATEIDPKTRTMFLKLTKDGNEVDSAALKGGETYIYNKRVGNIDNLPLILVRFDSVFVGTEFQAAFLRGIFQISEDFTPVQSGNKFGVMEITQVSKDKIVMKNNDSVDLNRGSLVDLMGDLKIIVADNDSLRYNPIIQFTRPGNYEVRGPVFNGSTLHSWTGRTFAGLYYDLDSNGYTETLELKEPINASRLIGIEELIYNTTKIHNNFKAFDKIGVNISGSTGYDTVGWQGQKWVAINGSSNRLARQVLEMGPNEKKTLAPGEVWSLGSGYELTIDSINARISPREVNFTLRKYGNVIDKGTGRARINTTIEEKQRAVYYKSMTILNETDTLLFTLYIDSIFSGATTDLVQFRYGWLIDKDSAMEIKEADRFGVFEVRNSNKDNIKLTNNIPVELSKNSVTILLGDIKFKVADSDILRFYPKVDQAIPNNSKPPSSLTIKINQDDVFTNSTSVNLSLSASNAEQMSFSSDNITWSPWEPFSTTRTWTLTGDNGPKTIYFKARNSNGEAGPVSDTIILDTTIQDTIPPSVVINSPASGAIVNAPNIVINGTANDKSGIKAGSIVHESKYGGSARGWPENNSTSIAFSHNITLYEGWNNINVTYTDIANNPGSASVNLTYVKTKPKVSFENRSVNISVNSSRLLNLTLDTAPAGLSGYNITISLSNGSRAKIISVDFPGLRPALHNNSPVPSDSVWIKATDLNETIKNGSSNIILARLGIKGDASGTADMIIDVRSMDDGNGARMDPDTSKTQISVISVLPLPSSSKSPTDPDNDGLYEDINGNGKKDFNDVVMFFNYIEWIEKNEPAACFDFNGNGRIDFNDIIMLFKEL